MSSRYILLLILLPFGAAILIWSVGAAELPPADFTFANNTEVQSVDPAIVTGVPEHRIIDAIFEGLTRLDPQTLEPRPAGAVSWNVSADQLVYTFHLRPEARWSNSDPVTAHDYVFAIRRFLDPQTAARYAYQAWYLKHARRYSLGSSGIGPGDPVEVELPLPAGRAQTCRGELLHGTLVRMDTGAEERAGQTDTQRTFLVRVDDQERRFRPTFDNRDTLPTGIEPCRQVILDFREVGIKAIDDLTLEMTLAAPTPFWTQLTAHYALFPTHRGCVERFGSPRWTYPENIISNGAFRLAARRIRDRIRLVKSQTYWDRDQVGLDVIDALAVESRTTAFNLYETGEVDWVNQAQPLIVRDLLKLGRDQIDLRPAPQLTIYFYGLNTYQKPLDDVRIRRALSLGINRQEITEVATGAGEVPALSFVPPGLPGYEPQFAQPEDVAQAQQLLADAGYPSGNGFPKLEILYNTDESHQAIAELVRKQWQRNLGITVSTRNEEWSSYLASQRQMEFQLVRRAWVGDYLDPNTFLDMFVTDGENNNTGWKNSAYDALIEAASEELDQPTRMRLLERAERILMSELPVIPIYYYVSRNLVKPYVRGLYNNLQDFHPLRAIYIDRQTTAPNEYLAPPPVSPPPADGPGGNDA